MSTNPTTVLYDGCSEIAGTLQPALERRIRLRPTMSGPERAVFTALLVLNVGASAAVLGWAAMNLSLGGAASLTAFALLVGMEVLRVTQNVSLWSIAVQAHDPVPVEPPPGLHLALVTTFVPSREPIELLASTLKAMVRVGAAGGRLDVWVLDEGDDPEVRRLASSLGVQHFSRHGRPEYNQPKGSFRERTKHGNHNAWRAEHEDVYDVVAHLDPEHAPKPDFFERTLGYFTDPDVAFVVTPHVYGNCTDGFVARAAAAHFYPFIGILQRGGNRNGTPMLIGANHLYRATAWKQIGGYQDSITEDHLTGLLVHANDNPATGHGWKGFFTPDVVAVGEAPVTWTDFFNQQKRWAWGTTDISLRWSPSLLRQTSRRQAMGYLAMQAYYPALAAVWFLGTALLGLTLTTGVTPLPRQGAWLLPVLASANVAQYGVLLWLRRFYLAEHERRALALNAVLLTAVTAPVYAAAVASAIFRRRLNFVVTGKGAFARYDSASTFRYHLWWLGLVVAALAVGGWRQQLVAASVVWAVVAILTALVPIAIAITSGRPRWRGAQPTGGSSEPSMDGAPDAPVV